MTEMTNAMAVSVAQVCSLVCAIMKSCISLFTGVKAPDGIGETSKLEFQLTFELVGIL